MWGLIDNSNQKNLRKKQRSLYIDANNLYGWAMNQLLPYKDSIFNSQGTLKQTLETDDFPETSLLAENDLKYHHVMREETKNTLFSLQNKKS